MKPEYLAICLELIPDNEIVRVKLSFGDEFELADCEVVDEAICGNRRTILSNVIRKVKGDKRFHKPGTKLEFGAEDVVFAERVQSGKILYEQNT